MTGPFLLGIDVGTTACKAAVVSLDGRELAHGRERTRWRIVPSGAEIDPDALLAAALGAARRAIVAAPEGPIIGVGVTSMAETGALLDGRGRPVAPAIAWHDRRGIDDAARLAADLGAASFNGATGLAIGPMPSLVKVRWLGREDPEALRRARRWLNVAEYIVRGLGGEEATELSLASRTGWLDQGTRDWWADALAWSGLGADVLPRRVIAGEAVGRVAPGILPRAGGAALGLAGHDHLGAAIGAGALRPGDVLDSCGTAEALVRGVPGPMGSAAVRAAVARGLSVGCHVVPGEQALLGGSLCGALLGPIRDRLTVVDERPGAGDRERPGARDRRPGGVAERTSVGGRRPRAGAFAALDEAALAAPAGTGGPSVRDGAIDVASLVTIAAAVSPGAAWRAAIEAVEADAARLLAAVEATAGRRGRLVVVGGWSRDPAIRAIKRETLGPFELPPVVEAGARGAALVGGVAAGIYPGVRDVPVPVPAAGAPAPDVAQSAQHIGRHP